MMTAWGQSVGAGWFTLTNGSLWYFEGGEIDTTADGKSDSVYLYRTGYDESYTPARSINLLGTHGSHIATHTLAQGSTYLKLDTSDANHPTVETAPTTQFDRLCMWYRTNYTGMYYQTWPGPGGKVYEYYLMASSGGGLQVYKYEKDTRFEPTATATWSNWDFGAAITEASASDVEASERYYWLIADDHRDADGNLGTREWTMSVNTYQRPDAGKYMNYHAEGDVNKWTNWTGQGHDTVFYDNIKIGEMDNYPRGAAATCMPVKVVDHTMDPPAFLAGTGVYSIETDEDEITINETMDVTTIVRTMTNDKMQVMHTPQYTEYIEETYRRGINLNYRNRSSEGWNMNGVAQTRTWYLEEGSNNISPNPPDPNMALQNNVIIDSVKYTIDPVGSRYLRIQHKGTELPTVSNASFFETDEWDCNTYSYYYDFFNSQTYFELFGVSDVTEITDEMATDFFGMGTLHLDHENQVVCVKSAIWLNHHPFEATIECFDIPLSPTPAKITAIVYYSNGITQTMTTTVTVKYQKKAEETVHSRRAPAIKGSVFGGGKMANVKGNTNVTVHATDTIYALYGGNDIAGWVGGDNGATVQIGTSQTSKYHPIHIGWVYGGGCGYYAYQNVHDGTSFGNTLVTGLEDNQHVFNGDVYPWGTTATDLTGDDPVQPVATGFTYDANATTLMDGTGGNGTIPYVKKTTVIVGEAEEHEHYDAHGHDAHTSNDYIYIDSLFGGAENAFAGVTTGAGVDPATAVDLTINGGTITSVFGGNNYGGGLASTSLTNVTVNCTRLVDEADMPDNTYFHGYGKDFGIRHLFGGGNLVESPSVNLTFKGGMVDTAFAGGNRASVGNPACVVDCRRSPSYPPLVNDYGHNGHFIYTNPYMTDTTNNGANHQDPRYTPNTGQYNVRMLFGGNNRAAMDNLSFVQLRSGGVGSVYGGGNYGDMTNDKDTNALASLIGTEELTMLQTINKEVNKSTLITAPAKVSSLIAAGEGSNIIADYVHGGCRNSNVKHSCGVYLAGGNYYDVWGGNDVSGDVGSETNGASYAMITGKAVVQGNVYGASDGYYHFEKIDADGKRTGRYDNSKIAMDQFNPDFDYDPFNEFENQLIPTQQHANIFVNGGLIKGDLVAGGVLSDVGFAEGAPKLIRRNGSEETMSGVDVMEGTVRLELAGDAEVRGNVYGGGAFASINGLSQVYVHGTPMVLGSLFAGNDCTGSVYGFLPFMSNLENDKNAYSYYRYYFDSVYTAGSAPIAATHADSVAYFRNHRAALDGRQAAIEKWNIENQRTSDDSPLNERKSDGSYSPLYNSYVLIEGQPIINSVYGSGNGAYNYPKYVNGVASYDYEGAFTQFPKAIVSESMAARVPEQKSTYIDIHTDGGFIDTVFGGGNGCSVERTVAVLLNNQVASATAPVNGSYPNATKWEEIRSKSERVGRHFAGGTLREGMTGKNFVGTIFGGNNFSTMSCVPQIVLNVGNVKNVYGGANAGEMTGLTNEFKDVFGETVTKVSTHVLAQNNTVTVTDTIFGGCRMSDISNRTYVEVRNTSTDGINCLFGGNDISGNVDGNTRIDISGGSINRVWGGSNGRYDFVPVGDQIYNVYSWGTYDKTDPKKGLIVTAGRPNVDSTQINLWGGTINASVFTGGSMADCDNTWLVVDDKRDNNELATPFSDDVTVIGALYGGGEGRWDDLHARDYEGNRWGNVNGSTRVDLYHAANVTSAMAYGGGGGGDVHNTYITTYDTWDSPFQKLFGGCWGSDVHGTTHLTFNGKDLVHELFGGNDFAGYVYSTEVVVNSGNFTNIYGGGNGEYPNSFYHTQHENALDPTYAYMGARDDAYEGADSLQRPNTEYVRITINGTKNDNVNVWQNVYGGGKVGTVLPLKKNADGAYVYVEDEYSELTQKMHRIPDTNRIKTETVSDPTRFSYIVTNIHGGKFHNDVFGGGRGASSEILEQARAAAETAYAAANTEATPEDIKAAGDREVNSMKKPLVYGVKVVNMDGGEVYHSLYGGSEFVHDGYPAECKIPTGLGQGNNPTLAQQLAVTTMRPSSIVNIAGGQVDHNLYGAGYRGNVYGSSFVNLGLKAIDSCTVWRNRYGTDPEDSTYSLFKPGFKVSASATALSDKLVESELMMNESVFSGANWGEGAGETQLDTRGFYGGESRLYVDGEGYNTGTNDIATEPNMNIRRSLLGSGTSVEGGDIHSQVELRNYGETDKCGTPIKTLESIQRTDSLWLHNSVVEFTGSTDASSVYQSNSYSLNRIVDVCYRGYNVTEYVSPINEVGSLAFYEQSSVESARHTSPTFVTPYIEVPISEINNPGLSTACETTADICEKTAVVSPTAVAKRHSLLILDNGIDFTIRKDNTYGPVRGFAYIVSPNNYSSLVSARNKIVVQGNETSEQYSSHPFDGGFSATCKDSNMTRPLSTDLTQTNPGTWTHSGTNKDEFPYTNHGTSLGNPYRVWKVGYGQREREATLLAHIKPAKQAQDQPTKLTAGEGSNTAEHNLAVAEVSFELPATEAGHYYTLKFDEGFEMDGSNMMMYLVDSAWSPNLGAQNGHNVNMTNHLATIGAMATDDNPSNDNVTNQGSWKVPAGATDKTGVTKILKQPESSFGLVMVPDKNFQLNNDNNAFVMPGQHTQSEANLVISGNQRVSSSYAYCSPKVYSDNTNDMLKPSMRLYLTYSPTFMTTFNGTVTFFLNELDEYGNDMGPIKVKVNIQTIIDELTDMEQNVLAMYNGGRTNKYTRKVVFPSLGEERQLYIEGIRWMPTDANGDPATAEACTAAFGTTDHFALLGDTNTLTATDIDGYPHDRVPSATHTDHSSHNRFGLTLMTTNDVAEASTQANGWGGSLDTVNLYELVYPKATNDGKTPVKTVTWDATENSVAYHDLTANGTTKGYKLGTLDGRGSAGLDVQLNFDGTRMYDDMPGKGYVGCAELHMKTYYEYGGQNELRDDFTVKIYVKTREGGDTIYVASADSVTRTVGGHPVTVYPYNNQNSDYTQATDASVKAALLGKVPNAYVQTLQKALDNDIYEEGDVIAILDTVQVSGVVQISGNKSVHTVGPLGPPIEVIRYDGHHHQLPDEESVFRGAMIKVSGEGLFSAQNIAFHGGAGARLKKIVRTSDGTNPADLNDPNYNTYPALLSGSNLQFQSTNYPYTLNNTSQTYVADKVPDTNRAFGPIIEITKGGEVSLLNGVKVQHNWNAYGSRTADRLNNGSGLTKHPELMGAISITKGGILKLKSNVDIQYNFSHTMSGYELAAYSHADSLSVHDAPGNGAIYVAGGTLELAETKRETAVKAVKNYLMNPTVHETNSTMKWFNTENLTLGGINIPERYSFDSTKIATWHRANVYLTRSETVNTSSTPLTGYEKMMYDDTTDVILVGGTVGDKTQLGVRKWFPGYQVRDTIRIARVNGGNNKVLENAVDNKIFVADDGFRVFYNSQVNNAHAYFFRCASFKHQWYVDDGQNQHLYVDPVYEYSDVRTTSHTLKLEANNVLEFNARQAACPTGGEYLVYRVQGGFMPYTYTWSDPAKSITFSTKETPYKNTQVQYDLAGGAGGNTLTGEARYAKYAASMTDTLLLPAEDVNKQENAHKWNHLLVSAVDATGECELHKYIDLRIKMNSTVAPNQLVTYMDDNTKTDNTTYRTVAPATTPDTAIASLTSPSDSLTDHAYWKTDLGNGWTDTSVSVKAIASRNFSGVKITPKVWVDRSAGTILATVDGDNNDYVYQYIDDESEVHELTGRLFCPGDVIHLKTVRRNSSNEFVMWDFDPYRHNPATYVVPPHNSTVTAYYAPGTYWYQHINTEAKAGAVLAEGYYYTGRPTVPSYTLPNGGTSTEAGYVTTYNGDVHIYNENGLAWLISTVNGLNGQQILPFYYNKVYLHKPQVVDGNGNMVDTVYDMSKYLWTPVGTAQHRFRGELIAVGPEDTTTTPLTNDRVTIKHIILNEPNMADVGFFGFLDTAKVNGIALRSSLVHGGQYVGGLAAHALKATANNCAVQTGISDNESPTIITTHYASGGFFGESNGSSIKNSLSGAKYIGDAVYNGGLAGIATNEFNWDTSFIENNQVESHSLLSGIYVSGIVSYVGNEQPKEEQPEGYNEDDNENQNGNNNNDGTQNGNNRRNRRGFLGRLFQRKSQGAPMVIANNYVHLVTDGNSTQVSGIVGHAENAIIENNYAYGELNSRNNAAGIGAAIGQNVHVDKSYYAKDDAKQAVGSLTGNATLNNVGTFKGYGNQVRLDKEVYGTDNLTRALNKWVREHNGNGNRYKTWRSDLEGINNGYPLFGEPDMIPVSSDLIVDGCDSIEWEGQYYTHDTLLTTHAIDSVEMVDSTSRLHFIIHHASRKELSDSATIGQDYAGYGFEVSSTASELLRNSALRYGYATLVVYDTLVSATGCDSIVCLTLTYSLDSNTTEVIEEPVQVHTTRILVYPNPTTAQVTVETDGLSRVELFDNEGRRLQDITAPHGSDRLTIDVSYYPTGLYYLRIHNSEGVNIQKLVKK